MILEPQRHIDQQQQNIGFRCLILDGICTQVMGSLVGGAFLVAFAVLLGASNLEIGLIAAIGPLTQILHVPATLLIEKIRRRKWLVINSSLISRIFLIGLCSIPWIHNDYQVAALLVFLFLYFGFGTISGSAFNSWWRDFVPDEKLSSLYADRLLAATGAGIVVTLTGAVWIDSAPIFLPSQQSAYALLFIVGGLFGFIGLYFLTKVPEPFMEPLPEPNLLAILSKPFREKNFK